MNRKEEETDLASLWRGRVVVVGGCLQIWTYTKFLRESCYKNVDWEIKVKIQKSSCGKLEREEKEWGGTEGDSVSMQLK